ncbi:VanZ family protein [Mesonia ostreae]|uniref:VanZ family protein n=1 Tax=Mesonia ostreae TaxID=861110 RepID=A0ABU2KFL6_9FLAO|nr:VanZ family protein [Mesonia ostreae]MDT0293453.1 VanZ family protein [Mesonia ostreae]
MQRLIKNLLAPKLILTIALLFSIGILYASLMRTDGLPKVNFDQVDKVFHFIAYLGLSLIWYLYYISCNLGKQIQKKPFLIIGLLIVAFGILIEVLQDVATSYRTIDRLDVLANSLGVLSAYILVIMLRLRIQNFKTKE